MKQPLKCAVLGIATSVILFSVGCKKEEVIGSYAAPKDNPPSASADAGAAALPAGTAPGSADSVANPSADLKWTLPAGWKQVPVPENPVFTPFAAFQVSDDPKLIMTVSRLPNSPGARSIPENVGRWARQLKMPEPTEADLSKLVTHIPLSNGLPLDIVTMGGTTESQSKLLGAILPLGDDTWVFKLSGDKLAVEAQSGAFADFLKSLHVDAGAAPAAVAGPPAPTPAAPVPASTASTGAGGAQWVLPAGWTADASENSFRVATIRPGNASAQIKVSKLGIVGGGLGMNVTRWHGEVGLPPVDDEHADAGQQLKIADQTWTLHDYTGPANGGTREIIASAEAGGATWYFKLAGPTDVIEKVKPEFDQFLKTVRLRQ